MTIEAESAAATSRSAALPPLIAVVGCDGSGKSTITALLAEWLQAFHPTKVCHLGKQSGNIGRSLGRTPLIGSPLKRTIAKKTKMIQTAKGPGPVTALGAYAFTLRRERRFNRMMALRRAGNLIIADRFPQIEVAGGIDGPSLINARATGMIGWLARSERRKFDTMVAQHPDLVVRLNVSLDVAKARKPDHRASSLARKIADLTRITFPGLPVLELNADEPLALVEAKAKAGIADMLKSRYGIVIPLPPAQ